MKTLTFMALSALLTTPATGANAATCGCPLVPLEGSYKSAEGASLTLKYVDGTKDSCPTAINLRGPRKGAKPVNVSLACTDGEWLGTEPSPLGAFSWMLTTPTDNNSPGLDMAETIAVTLSLPPKMKAVGKRDRAFEMSLTSKARAPACLCEDVRAEREHAATMQKLFGNKQLQKMTEKLGLRGNKSTAKYYLDSKGQLQPFAKRSAGKYSYHDLVVASLSQQVKISDKGVTVDAPIEVAAEAAAKPRPKGQLQKGAAATTDPATCKINMPKAKEIAANCTPAVVLKAWHLHESHHRKICLRLRDKKVTTPDGKAQIVLNDPLQLYKGDLMPTAAYSAYNQLPSHIGQDEEAAYGSEIAVYDTWLKQYCPG